MLARDHHAELRVLEHERDAFTRILGIERNISAARLEHAERSDHQLNRSLHMDADELVRRQRLAIEGARPTGWRAR